jgi:hypothetical protein
MIIIFAKFTYGNKRLKYIGNLTPHPQYTVLVVLIWSLQAFFTFRYCVHDVNMTHACMQVPHTPVLIQCITPLLRVKIPDHINRVPLCPHYVHTSVMLGAIQVKRM